MSEQRPSFTVSQGDPDEIDLELLELGGVPPADAARIRAAADGPLRSAAAALARDRRAFFAPRRSSGAVWRASLWVDKHPEYNLRFESAMVKLETSEQEEIIVDHAVQIFGGLGYETARSKMKRGEKGDPIEQMHRDARIDRIFEGTSEINYLANGREAVDMHKKKLEPLLNPARNPLMTEGAVWPETWTGLGLLVGRGIVDELVTVAEQLTERRS